MTDQFIWLSPQGRAPVLVNKDLLVKGASRVLRRMFDGSMALPPRVDALEVTTTVGQPVYLINVSEAILTVLLDALAHPQLQYRYSVNMMHPEADTRRTYLRYYGLFTTKIAPGDEDKVTHQLKKQAKARKKEHEVKKRNREIQKADLYIRECNDLYQYLAANAFGWPHDPNRVRDYHVKMEFIHTFDKKSSLADRTHYLTTSDGKQRSIAWFFFSRNFEWTEKCKLILKGLCPGLKVTETNRWERAIFLTETMRTLTHWPAINTLSCLDARYHEVVCVDFHFGSNW